MISEKREVYRMNQNYKLNKFYSFINMYNLIIDHCASKERTYQVDAYYINGEFYLKVLDKQSQKYIYDDSITCTEAEASMLANTMASEFVLNHRITLSSFANVSGHDVQNFYVLNGSNSNVSCKNNTYYNNDIQMQVFVLINSIFTLRIHYYNGVDEIAKQIHAQALEKLNLYNIEENKTYQKSL